MGDTVEPYLQILSNWIFKGILKDPYSEFVIQEVQDVSESDSHKSIRSFWDKKYSIEEENNLCLFSSLGEKILGCGKYVHLLNLFSQLRGKSDKEEIDLLAEEPCLPFIKFFPNPRYYSELIDSQYQKVSKDLFTLLIKKEKVMEKLR